MLSSHKDWRPWRWAKTLFFLLSMLLSLLLVCAPPLLVAILDVLLPSVLLSRAAAAAAAAVAASNSLPPNSSIQFTGFSFHASLIDVPIISAARSLLILCFYAAFNGRRPYLGITAACSFLSVGYVSAKAAVFMHGRWWTAARDRDGVIMIEVLFLASLAFAVAHVVVAYKTSCREQRKMIVYRIDVESVSAYHNDFPNYHKVRLSK